MLISMKYINRAFVKTLTKPQLKYCSNSSKDNKTFQINMQVPKVKNTKLTYSRKQTNNKITEEENKNKINTNNYFHNIYYELPLRENFNIFMLRSYYYSYLLSLSTNGKLYLNIDDSEVNSNKEKNDKLKEFLEALDLLKLSFNMPLDLKTSQDKKLTLFQSDRVDSYIKYMQFLLDNDSAFTCTCNTFNTCTSHCKSNSNTVNFKEDIYLSNNHKIRYIRINKSSSIPMIRRNANSDQSSLNHNEILIQGVNNNEKIINLDTIEDFPIFKNFTKEFSPSFKSTIDDHLYQITHKIEQVNYSIEKDFILTNMLQFKVKTYTHLPKVNIQYWNKTDFQNLQIPYLIKNKKILPEAVLNTALIMGWSENPIKELESSLPKKGYVAPIIDLDSAIEKFNTIDIYEINSYFSSDNLFYYNNKYLNYYFFKYPNELYFENTKDTYKAMKYPLDFKKEFYSVFGEKHKQTIDSWDEGIWRKVIKVIIPKIKSYEFLYLFSFLLESPILNEDFLIRNQTLIKGFFLNNKKALLFMFDFISMFKSIEETNFKSKILDKMLSEFVYAQYTSDKTNENMNRLVYSILKISIIDNLSIQNISDICEVIGKREVVNRLENFNNVLEKINY